MEELFKEFEFNEKPEKMIIRVNGLTLPEDTYYTISGSFETFLINIDQELE